MNPNTTIAEDAGVPYSTAARWIAKAREKRYLGKARQGKVTV
jgi:transposase